HTRSDRDWSSDVCLPIWIEPLRNLADVFAERFEVAQECRAREHIDLRAGVVDVIFARDVVAGKVKQTAQRVAEHRTAAMADMHRSEERRVGKGDRKRRAA